jgi:hypothetical protein
LKAELGFVAVCSKMLSATLPIGCDCGRPCTDSAARIHVSKTVAFHDDPILQLKAQNKPHNQSQENRDAVSAIQCFNMSHV